MKAIYLNGTRYEGDDVRIVESILKVDGACIRKLAPQDRIEPAPGLQIRNCDFEECDPWA